MGASRVELRQRHHHRDLQVILLTFSCAGYRQTQSDGAAVATPAIPAGRAACDLQLAVNQFRSISIRDWYAYWTLENCMQGTLRRDRRTEGGAEAK